MSKILRVLNNREGITIYCPDQAGFCDQLLDNIINHMELNNKTVRALLFLECEERNITNLLSKNISINSPANVTFEIEKLKIKKYRGFNLEFPLNNNLIDNSEVKIMLDSINKMSTSNGKRTQVGVIDCDDLMFFTY